MDFWFLGVAIPVALEVLKCRDSYSKLTGGYFFSLEREVAHPQRHASQYDRCNLHCHIQSKNVGLTLDGRKLRRGPSSKGLQYCSVKWWQRLLALSKFILLRKIINRVADYLEARGLTEWFRLHCHKPSQERQDSNTPNTYSGRESGSAQNRRNSVLKVATVLLARSCKSGYAR